MQSALLSLAQKHVKESSHPLIVILGPTASGKTAASVELALSLRHDPIDSWTGAEIVNADSRQLYRGLDIGTAKATMEERRGEVHHLFDVLDPKDDVTAADFQKLATEAIDGILSRGHVPILTGGSMLYIAAVTDGLSFAGKSDPAVRQRLSEEYDLDAGVTLQKRLTELDPEAAQSTDIKNKVYMIRAMEIAEQLGAVGESKTRSVSPYDVLMIGLRWQREVLTTRIDVRTSQLLQNGWIDEVRGLIAKGYTNADPGMISHGYREIAQWISDGEKVSELATLEASIAAQTRQYAKRQMTWWKRDPRIHWIEMM